MQSWQKVLQPTEIESSTNTIQNWFTQIAQHLLNHSFLLVNNSRHRLIEIECYYFSSNHQDFATHRDTLQTQPERCSGKTHLNLFK